MGQLKIFENEEFGQIRTVMATRFIRQTWWLRIRSSQRAKRPHRETGKKAARNGQSRCRWMQTGL